LTSVAEPIQRGVQSAADKTGKIIAGPNYKFKPEDPKSQDFQDRENALYGTAVGGAALAGAGAAARKGSEVLTGVKRPNPNWAERWGVRAGKAGVYGALGNSLLQDPSKNETEEGRSLGTNAAFAADTAIRGDIGQGALKNPNANILQRAGGRVMQGLNIARKLGIVGLIGHSLLPKPADSDNQAPSDSVNRSGRGDRMLNPTPLKRQQ
jgi:hypothetical protein